MKTQEDIIGYWVLGIGKASSVETFHCCEKNLCWFTFGERRQDRLWKDIYCQKAFHCCGRYLGEFTYGMP